MANLAFEGLVGGLQRHFRGVVEQSPQGLPRKVGAITDRDNRRRRGPPHVGGPEPNSNLIYFSFDPNF